MFRAIILPIFRSTRLCVTACGMMHPRCYQPAISSVHYTTSCNTQSSVPEDGQYNCPKHVELIGIINKPLLLHLVGCLCYSYQWCTVKQISNLESFYLNSRIRDTCNGIFLISYKETKPAPQTQHIRHIQYEFSINLWQLEWSVLHCTNVTWSFSVDEIYGLHKISV